MIGFVGAGTMAEALARGLECDFACTDNGSGRARALANACGGEVLGDNAALARASSIVVLCHGGDKLAEVASEIDGHARLVVSILSGVESAELRAAFRSSAVVRVAVNLAVTVRRGVICVPRDVGVDAADERRLLSVFSKLGKVFRLDEKEFAPAISIAGVGAAQLSVIAETQAEAAIRHGLRQETAVQLAAQTMGGTAALLDHGLDTLSVRRRIASPGGPTARSLEALEHGGVRSAIYRATAAVVTAAGEQPQVELGRPACAGPFDLTHIRANVTGA